VIPSVFFASQENALNEIKLIENPQDVIKAVVSVQEENAKLKKQVEQLIRDKAKGLKNELTQQIQEINGPVSWCKWILTGRS
jgi:alanyl-tRNA synthetase